MIMRRFNIYVVWEITKLFSLALVAFTTLFMLFGAGKELMNQSLGLWVILDLLPYLLPFSLQFALPATLLFAVCSVYGRISADNEILAVMAAGVSPFRVMIPTLVASLVLSLFAVWINDIAFSWGRPGINRVVMHSIEHVVYHRLATHGSYYSDSGFTIHVHGIGADGRELILPTITTIPKAGGDPLSISARAARLSMDPVKEVLRIELVDSEIEGKGFSSALPGPSVHEVSLSSATKKGTSSGHASEIPMRRIGYEIREQVANIKETQEILAARTAMALGIGKHTWLDSARTHDALSTVYSGKNRLARLNLEPWRRWASGFSCFFFVWVGIPLAVWMRSADHWTSFGTCFMPILLIYYPVFAVGLEHAKDGSWPSISVWLGNVVLLAVGGWWLRKVCRN